MLCTTSLHIMIRSSSHFERNRKSSLTNEKSRLVRAKRSWLRCLTYKAPQQFHTTCIFSAAMKRFPEVSEKCGEMMKYAWEGSFAYSKSPYSSEIRSTTLEGGTLKRFPSP